MTTGDRNFDDMADHFHARIGNQLKGRLRREVVWRDLADLAPDLHDRPRHVLDAGGGYGQMSVECARRGHAVTYCDVSSVMAGKAQALAAEAGVQGIEFVVGPAQLALPEGQCFDLVLGHAMLEWTASPLDVLASLAGRVASGGWLSLLFFNRWSQEFNLLRLGDLEPVLAQDFTLNAFRLTPTHPLDPDVVAEAVECAGLRVLRRAGVRVFCDYMQRDRRKLHSEATLESLEMAYSLKEPFWRFGRYVHLLAHRA